MKNTNRTIGILGFGRFGKLVQGVIENNFTNFQLNIFDIDPNFKNSKFFTPLNEVVRSDILIICVPISSFEKTIVEIKNKLRPNTLVIDVCSVKVHPVKIMLKHIPKHTQIIATHPMFGPDSAEQGVRDHIIVLCNIRTKPGQFSKFKQLLNDIGLETVEIGPDEHDKLSAFTQAYVHLLGRLGEKLNIRSTPINTKAFEKLLEVQQVVTNDTIQLFHGLQLFNPYAKNMRKNVIKAVTEIDKQIARNN